MGIENLAIVQARMGSIRFPGKVLKKINNKSLIEILLSRLSKSKNIDKIILATSIASVNDKLSQEVKALGYDVFRGSENNVLDRYYLAAKQYSPSTIVRITGDCPLIDPVLVDQVIDRYIKNDVDYVSNNHPPTYPDGLDTEVFSFQSLEDSWQNAKKNYELEHVTPYILNKTRFKKLSFENEIDCSKERWTVDEIEDFEVIKNIISHFSPNIFFSWQEVFELKNNHPNYFSANKNIIRNEGANLGPGQKLYKRAKKIIPGGTMLLSKRPEMFLPDIWPSYYSKTKGCYVWDLQGNKYIDMSIMGIGTNTLGYSNPEVDDAVHEVIDKGNLSTLNCPEEVYLADKLIDIHPWASMVRFARSGGEANAISIRIARAASGKDKVAICGYHGWHDWYLAANLESDSSLDGHLLPGLDPKGVPEYLRGTTLPFKYNDYDALKKIVEKNDIGAIKMEVSRSEEPKDEFLQLVRKLATENSIPLIFDECTSGFRETFGGLHKKYNVTPDIIMLGKTLGNGYAITAVVGKEEIMRFAEQTFISSTFWTERIGPTAALKTLEIMERKKSWIDITNKGKNITKRWRKLAKKYDLPLESSGLPALTSFVILSKNWFKYKTFITQEMLKKGILASNSIYSCTEHDNFVTDIYFHELDIIFKTISACEQNIYNIDELIDSEICHSGFRRLN
jgi:glutamate-1-semialdehyde 2,1-aminomutase